MNSKNKKPSCFASSSSQSLFENKENQSFSINNSNDISHYSCRDHLNSRVLSSLYNSSENPNFNSNIHKENHEFLMTTGILPDYKSKDFEIVNKLNKHSFENNSDFIEFQNKRHSKTLHVSKNSENLQESSTDDDFAFKKNSKFFQTFENIEKIYFFSKKFYFLFFVRILKNYNNSSKSDKFEYKKKDLFMDNSSTQETGCYDEEKNKVLLINDKIKGACNILISFCKLKGREKEKYYLMKWRFENKIWNMGKEFENKLLEKDKIHDIICEQYKELMNFERENFVKRIQTNFLGLKKKNCKKENGKNPTKADILMIFDNYYEEIAENIIREKKENEGENHNKKLIKEKNKLLLFNLVLNLIDEF